MNYNAVLISALLLLSSQVSLAQQQAGDAAKTEAEEPLGSETVQNEETLPEPPPAPRNKVFKPSTEISDDSPVAFPVDI